MKSTIGLDIETAKIPHHYPWKEDYYLCCLSLSFPNDTCKTWFFEHNDVPDPDYDANFKEVQAYIDQYDVVACHNAKFELNNLRKYLTFKEVWCTQVAEYLITYHCNKGLKLNDVAPKYGFGFKLDKVKTMWDAGYETKEVPMSLLIEYCEDDAIKARRIAQRQMVVTRNMGLMPVATLQMEWLDVLSGIESNGMVWDNVMAHRILERYTKYNSVLDKSITRLLEPFLGGQEVNLGSNDDLSIILYGGAFKRRVKVPVIKTKNIKVQMPYVFTYKDGTTRIKKRWNDHPDTKIIRQVLQDRYFECRGLGLTPLPKTAAAKSTDVAPLWQSSKEVLQQLKTETRVQRAVLKLLIHKSKINKVVSTFWNEKNGTGLISKIANDGRLHTNYNQTVTATGRLSSSDPNSQNLPRGNTSPIKTCIVPEFDGIMNADISQIELRVPAQLSQDSVMMQEFIDGEDLHSNGCVHVMKLPLNKLNRIYAKIFNFRIIYGGTEWGFFKDPKMPPFKLKKWKEIIAAYFTKYAGLKRWHDANIAHVINGDGTLTLPTGRVYKFKLDFLNKYNEREIKNYPVQGLAGGDILPLAAVIIKKTMRARHYKSKIIMTVHDSLVFDYVESEKDALARLCLHVFNNLPKYIKSYWGINWLVPITGEIETGGTYGSQSFYC